MATTLISLFLLSLLFIAKCNAQTPSCFSSSFTCPQPTPVGNQGTDLCAASLARIVDSQTYSQETTFTVKYKGQGCSLSYKCMEYRSGISGVAFKGYLSNILSSCGGQGKCGHTMIGEPSAYCAVSQSYCTDPGCVDLNTNGNAPVAPPPSTSTSIITEITSNVQPTTSASINTAFVGSIESVISAVASELSAASSASAAAAKSAGEAETASEVLGALSSLLSAMSPPSSIAASTTSTGSRPSSATPNVPSTATSSKEESSPLSTTSTGTTSVSSGVASSKGSSSSSATSNDGQPTATSSLEVSSPSTTTFAPLASGSSIHTGPTSSSSSSATSDSIDGSLPSPSFAPHQTSSPAKASSSTLLIVTTTSQTGTTGALSSTITGTIPTVALSSVEAQVTAASSAVSSYVQDPTNTDVAQAAQSAIQEALQSSNDAKSQTDDRYLIFLLFALIGPLTTASTEVAATVEAAAMVASALAEATAASEANAEATAPTCNAELWVRNVHGFHLIKRACGPLHTSPINPIVNIAAIPTSVGCTRQPEQSKYPAQTYNTAQIEGTLNQAARYLWSGISKNTKAIGALEANDFAGKARYPHTFMNYDGVFLPPDFLPPPPTTAGLPPPQTTASLWEFPIVADGVYNVGRQNRDDALKGIDRAIFLWDDMKKILTYCVIVHHTVKITVKPTTTKTNLAGPFATCA